MVVNIRILKFKKNTGCILEVIVFSNGKVTSCWQTGVPEVAYYDNLELFLKVRTPERGYTKIFDSGDPCYVLTNSFLEFDGNSKILLTNTSDTYDKGK